MSRARACVPVLAAAAGLAAAAQGSAAVAAAPKVEVIVVGKSGVLRDPVRVTARATTVAVGKRRCVVGARTALAALDGARRARGPSFRVRDYGACSRRAVDAGSLFVFQVGGDRNRGRDGWVYKVGRTVPTVGAADLSRPRLRAGQRVTWFYCRMARSGSCQRTLEITVDAAKVGRGGSLRAVVRGYDDFGRGQPIADATVEMAGTGVLTGADGAATVPAPARPGRVLVTAERDDLVPAFPAEVTVT